MATKFYIDKICRTCLKQSEPILSIYDKNGSLGCVADMLRDFTKIKPQRHDGMPGKVCLPCMNEINRSYLFKSKCENSEATLRKLVPDVEGIKKIKLEKGDSKTEKSIPESELATSQHPIVIKEEKFRNCSDKTENLHYDITLISNSDEQKISETNKLETFASPEDPNQLLQHEIVYEIKEEIKDCESINEDVNTGYYLVSDSQRNNIGIEVRQNLNNDDITDYADEDIVNNGNRENIADTNSAVISQPILSPQLMKIHHTTQFKCTECFQIYETNSMLSIHMMNVHKRKIKYQCKHGECKKVFSMLSTYSTLQDHIRTHSDEKQFSCFSQSAPLEQHVMRHNNKKPLKCNECSESFGSNCALLSHKRTHTGDITSWQEVLERNFTWKTNQKLRRLKKREEIKCTFCPMTFSYLINLKKHCLKRHPHALSVKPDEHSQ